MELCSRPAYFPDLGRFISVDPIEDGSNWYAFAGNDPVNYADPSGLSASFHPLGNSTLSPAYVNAKSIFAGLGPQRPLHAPTSFPIGTTFQGAARPPLNHVAAEGGIEASYRALGGPQEYSSPFSPFTNYVQRGAARVWGNVTDAGRAVERELNQTTAGFRVLADEQFDGNLGPSGPLSRVGDAYRSAVHGATNIVDSAVYNANFPVRVDDNYQAYRRQGVSPRNAAALAVGQQVPGGNQLLTIDELFTGQSIRAGEVNRPLYTQEQFDRFRNLTVGVMTATAGYFASRRGSASAPDDGVITYGELDNLRRPTGVTATITERMLNTGTAARNSIRPPGFEGGAAGHARAHLLGSQLGGSGADRRNLVTLQHIPANTPVMRGFEDEMATVIRNGQTVTLSVTPIYHGSNSIPRGLTLQGTGTGGFSIGVSILNPAGL